MSRRVIEKRHRKWAGLVLVVTGVCVALYGLRQQQQATPDDWSGGGLLLIMGVAAIVIGGILAFTGKRIIRY